MRTICAILSWIIWTCGALIVAQILFFAPALLAQKSSVSTSQNPLTDLVLAILMLVFSIAATLLRRRLGSSARMPSVDALGGVFFWLCLVSFAVCFACGATMLGITQSMRADDLKFVYIFGGLAAVALLFCSPILPKPTRAVG